MASSPSPILVTLDLYACDPEVGPDRVVACPDPFHVGAGQVLVFQSPYPFALEFPSAAPLVGPMKQAEASTLLLRNRSELGPEVADALTELEADPGLMEFVLARVVRRDANRVEPYKYVVTLARPDGDTVFLQMTDPRGVIEPDPV
jgi:hypothetical protein